MIQAQLANVHGTVLQHIHPLVMLLLSFLNALALHPSLFHSLFNHIARILIFLLLVLLDLLTLSTGVYALPAFLELRRVDGLLLFEEFDCRYSIHGMSSKCVDFLEDWVDIGCVVMQAS